MVDKRQGVVMHITAQNLNIFIVGYPCHLIHLSAKKGCQNLTYQLNDLLAQFRLQGVIRIQLRQMIKKILKCVSTRLVVFIFFLCWNLVLFDKSNLYNIWCDKLT